MQKVCSGQSLVVTNGAATARITIAFISKFHRLLSSPRSVTV
jgi:hypothetical protein